MRGSCGWKRPRAPGCCSGPEPGAPPQPLHTPAWPQRSPPRRASTHGRPRFARASPDREHGAPRPAAPPRRSLVLAADPGALPDARLLLLFGAGAVLLRGAGCTINDFWARRRRPRLARDASEPSHAPAQRDSPHHECDRARWAQDRDIDAQVERTRNRPLASGQARGHRSYAAVHACGASSRAVATAAGVAARRAGVSGRAAQRRAGHPAAAERFQPRRWRSVARPGAHPNESQAPGVLAPLPLVSRATLHSARSLEAAAAAAAARAARRWRRTR